MFLSISVTRTSFTQRGVCYFSNEGLAGNLSEIEKDVCEPREGFYGWIGIGGSIFQVTVYGATL